MLNMLHTNQLEGFKIGTRWKIPKETVIEFIRHQ
ncbi:MAG: helix-turn-helix domain-containing protein [Eubacterium sp.]|nr:helix-turn-helix domain-containing protein [Eubacterium sp.]